MRVPIPERLQWHRPTLFGWFQCSLMAYVLWSLFYVQFLLSVVYGWPFLGRSVSFSLGPYLKVEGYPWTLAELFLWVSVIAGAVSMVSAIVVTGTARAKWRLRFMVLLFAAFPIGFAWFQYAVQDFHIELAEQRLAQFEEDRRKRPDLVEADWYDRRVENLRAMLKRVER